MDSVIVEVARPRDHYRAADDDPSVLPHIQLRCATRHQTALDRTSHVALMAAVQMMCAELERLQAGPCRESEQAISTMAFARSRHRPFGREHDQHRGRSAAWLMRLRCFADQLTLVCGGVCTSHFVGNGEARVSPNRNVLKWMVWYSSPIQSPRSCGRQLGRCFTIPSCHLPHTRDEWATLVAILGTTISPYLFFWQASEEVEEEKLSGQSTLALRKGATMRSLS